MSLTSFGQPEAYFQMVDGLLSTNEDVSRSAREMLLRFCDNFGVSRLPSPMSTQPPSSPRAPRQSPSPRGSQRSPSPRGPQRSSPEPRPIDTQRHVRFNNNAYPSPVYPDELGIGGGRTHQGYELNNKYYIIPRPREEQPLRELLWYRKVGIGHQLILLTPRGRNEIPIISTAPSSRYGEAELIRNLSS